MAGEYRVRSLFARQGRLPLRTLPTLTITRLATITLASSLVACASVTSHAPAAAAPTADASDFPESAFARFFGTWTLRDDQFQQVWDTRTLETLTIPNHLTNCAPVNTAKSVLCVVDAGDLRGHILWAFDDASSELRHLSHFGTSRLGAGRGTLSEGGDLTITIRFSDEPEQTYRVYEYRWIDKNAYSMVSRQFHDDGSQTGNWYGGTFVRVQGPRNP